MSRNKVSWQRETCSCATPQGEWGKSGHQRAGCRV